MADKVRSTNALAADAIEAGIPSNKKNIGSGAKDVATKIYE